MRTLLYFLTLLISLSAEARRGIEMQRIVNDIAADNEFSSHSPQWQRFDTLREMATNNELIELTWNRNAVVRCYTYLALAERKGVDMFPVTLRYLADHEVVFSQFGCIGMQATVSSEVLDRIWQFNKTGHYDTLPPTKKRIIDSMVIFGKDIQSAYCFLTYAMQSDPAYYDWIKSRFSDQHMFLVEILAKYQHEDDTVLIRQALNTKPIFGLRAISNFPHPVFYPVVKQMQVNACSQRKYKNKNDMYLSDRYTDSELIALYDALLKYRTPETRALLDHTLKNVPPDILKEHEIPILLAIKHNPDKLYDGLKKKIRLNWAQKSEGNIYGF